MALAHSDPNTLRARNRPLIAERLGYPDGVVEAAEALERRYRGVDVWYAREPGQEPGYYARATHPRFGDPRLYAPDPEQLAQLIQAHIPGHRQSTTGPNPCARCPACPVCPACSPQPAKP